MSVSDDIDFVSLCRCTQCQFSAEKENVHFCLIFQPITQYLLISLLVDQESHQLGQKTAHVLNFEPNFGQNLS